MSETIRVTLPESDGPGGNSDDVIQPYMIDATGLHGRMVKLGASINTIVSRHGYPEPVSILLAEFLALCAGLAAALKYDGVFTLQTKGDGPVPMLVADVTSEGHMRGYASVKGEIPPLHEALAAPVPKLLGEGYLAFTVDQGQHMERYQGIVALEGATIEECVHRYFEQSDQFASSVKLAAGRRPDGTMAGSALLVQRLPDEGGDDSIGIADEDAWRRAVTLMASAKVEEMLDPALPPNDLLFRLFHEDGVRVFDPRSVDVGCRCTRAKIEGVLLSLEPTALADVQSDEGTYDVLCEFCSKTEVFTDADLDAARAKLAAQH